VATQMTHDQLIRQVLQGGGNMPAYGKNLSPPEVEALVAFLETLHKPGQKPAVDESEQFMKMQQSTSAPQAVPPVGNGSNIVPQSATGPAASGSATTNAPPGK
jgi:ubiquinol-cytochrome c reductase cytochrome b subunit